MKQPIIMAFNAGTAAHQPSGKSDNVLEGLLDKWLPERDNLQSTKYLNYRYSTFPQILIG